VFLRPAFQDTLKDFPLPCVQTEALVLLKMLTDFCTQHLSLSLTSQSKPLGPGWPPRVPLGFWQNSGSPFSKKSRGPKSFFFSRPFSSRRPPLTFPFSPFSVRFWQSFPPSIFLQVVLSFAFRGPLLDSAPRPPKTKIEPGIFGHVGPPHPGSPPSQDSIRNSLLL